MPNAASEARLTLEHGDDARISATSREIPLSGDDDEEEEALLRDVPLNDDIFGLVPFSSTRVSADPWQGASERNDSRRRRRRRRRCWRRLRLKSPPSGRRCLPPPPHLHRKMASFSSSSLWNWGKNSSSGQYSSARNKRRSLWRAVLATERSTLTSPSSSSRRRRPRCQGQARKFDGRRREKGQNRRRKIAAHKLSVRERACHPARPARPARPATERKGRNVAISTEEECWERAEYPATFYWRREGLKMRHVFLGLIRFLLPAGDEVLAVNGLALQGLSHSEAISVFKNIRAGRVVIHVARREANSNANQPSLSGARRCVSYFLLSDD